MIEIILNTCFKGPYISLSNLKNIYKKSNFDLKKYRDHDLENRQRDRHTNLVLLFTLHSRIKPYKEAHHCFGSPFKVTQKKKQRKLNQQKKQRTKMGRRNREYINDDTSSSSSSLSEALIFATLCIIGLPVDVHVQDGSVYTGIFHTACVEEEYGMSFKLCFPFHFLESFSGF